MEGLLLHCPVPPPPFGGGLLPPGGIFGFGSVDGVVPPVGGVGVPTSLEAPVSSSSSDAVFFFEVFSSSSSSTTVGVGEGAQATNAVVAAAARTSRTRSNEERGANKDVMSFTLIPRHCTTRAKRPIRVVDAMHRGFPRE